MAIFTYALSAPAPPACRAGVLTIGNFDGVHLGHQALLTEAMRQARLRGVPCIAVTFDPHPAQLLRPERQHLPLTSSNERTTLLQQYGVDHVLVLQTSPELLQLSAREFFEQVVVDRLQAVGMVEGYSFGFGKNREGTTEILQQFCAEKQVFLTLLPPCEVTGMPVSSSRVRQELLAGLVHLVVKLLGRPYRISGIVGKGQQRGATLGFPTANLDHVTTLIPGNGVYAVRVLHADKSWPAAANVGPNPTFGENARKIEVHLLGYTGDLYDHPLTVDFIAKIRDTRPFTNAHELSKQINSDVAEAAKLLAG
jgi:riboflavin kinase/FMN adenylyltransferase